MWDRNGGYNLAKYAKNIHQVETKANWISVRVIGFGKALRIDLEEVLVNAEVKYHIRQRIWSLCQMRCIVAQVRSPYYQLERNRRF